MNILTFDIEEWYLNKFFLGANPTNYQLYDRYLKSILDLLDENNLKATFFCVGGMATYFPEIVKTISGKGHEIGCHSNEHTWLTRLSREEFKQDSEIAIRSLEDVVGKKVKCYRAPAFSVCQKNKWVFEVLSEYGIECDSSIYPANRNFGGFPDFPTGKPCLIQTNGTMIKEFPICLTDLFGKKLAYLGGGYFRFFPTIMMNHIVQKSNYNMTYLHIGDLMYHPLKLQEKAQFEKVYKIPGTVLNRTTMMFKKWIGTKHSYEKMCRLISSFDFVDIKYACDTIDWNKVEMVEL